MIHKIKFKNYKVFKEQQTLELRPITIIIGKNNSGKSAVVRLPTLVSGSLSGEFKEPVRLNNSGVRLGVDLSDLVYNKRTLNRLELAIESESEKLEVAIKFPENTLDRTTFYTWNYYCDDVLARSKDDDLVFEGFMHKGTKFKDLNLNLDYIGAFRELPKDYYTFDSQTYSKIGNKGENAYPILINNSVFAQRVSEWYQQNFEGWKIEVATFAATNGFYQILLSNKDISRVNIVNTGQGINQVLPLIVRSYMPDEKEVLIIIEEPETHLHPAAHGNLAERFVDSYLEDNNKHYLIETHSQNFVLRVRRLVAEGKLKKEDLAIYYVDFDDDKSESSLKLIEVDDLGEVDWWPEDIFNEGLKEVIGIRKAQKTS